MQAGLSEDRTNSRQSPVVQQGFQAIARADSHQQESAAEFPKVQHASQTPADALTLLSAIGDRLPVLEIRWRWSAAHAACWSLINA